MLYSRQNCCGWPYILGFRVDPADKLGQVAKEIGSIHAVYSEKPIFGVEYDRKSHLAVASTSSADDSSQVWSLTRFYSVDFSQSRIAVKEFVFNKRSIMVCVSCF